MEKKFELSERVRKDLKQSIEEAKKTLEVKEKEIQDLKDGPRQAKEVMVCEYRDFDALLSELRDSFLQGFDDALRQVKKVFPDLDVSNIKVEDKAQTSIMPVASDNTNNLFAEVDALGDGESTQTQPVAESARPRDSHSVRHGGKTTGKYFSSKLVVLIYCLLFFFFLAVYFLYLENNFICHG